MDTFAFHQPGDNKHLWRAYAEELDMFIKAPLKSLHELLVCLWERGDVYGNGDTLDNFMTSFWTLLLTWDNLDNHFTNEWKKSKGLPPLKKKNDEGEIVEIDAEPRTAEEKRYITDLQVKLGLLPERLKWKMFCQIVPAETAKTFMELLEQKMSEEKESEAADN